MNKEISFSNPGSVYFCGIGGISMSGLAMILSSRGFKVYGSDSRSSEVTDKLIEEGIRVFIGQSADNLTAVSSIDYFVYTAAVHTDNPEYQKALEMGLNMMTRAELLGRIMKEFPIPVAVAGTHGKTTTSSMLSQILLEADADPTLSIGGILSSIGGNTRIGHSPLFVAEACEYTNSFLSFFPKISIILDIDADHLDFFKDLQDIRNSFRKFAGLLPDDGTLIIGKDIEDLDEITDGLTCNIVTFGLDTASDYYADNISYNDMAIPSFTIHAKGHADRRVTLKVPGRHNILNALAAAAAADLCGQEEYVSQGLGAFEGTNRRFQYKGEVDGLTIVDDYAHHPTEIRATLAAASACNKNKLWVVFQPHTYTRTQALMDEFANALCLADEIVLADIYAARETDDLGISSRTLKARIESLGHSCHYAPSFDEIEKFLLKNCTKGDLLITMGAGDVYKIGDHLLGK
ncbi:UDP-N-acetylmuramate--L-alanine ligase [Butyrivibrio sp. MC2013]|uniref:UDP-N-acetylmuramate--L-alanine ligase n=1 Tax=Butyrivibrio sp. MC2013 TaxID=1280686 RepID=UPI00047E7E80|nr:UDP-N-acetylmuramate--L-alanine ligase [Butyrivibrio sp. MC2013]